MPSTPPFQHHRIRAYASRYLTHPRSVEVFLPPEPYPPVSRTRLLIMNDGQDADAIGLSRTLARLHNGRRIAPLVVAAVHATHARLHEYGTAGVANASGLGGCAAAYSAFVCEELLPELRLRYGFDPGPRHTAIAGFSLGGLMAFDIAWAHPELFGAVGVFSGSFWWRTDDSSVRAKVASRIMHRKVRSSASLPPLRMWLQAGTEDETSDRDGDGIIDAIQDTTELVDTLAERGYRRGRDIVYREVEGGRHDQATWGRILPEFLEWLAPAGEVRGEPLALPEIPTHPSHKG